MITHTLNLDTISRAYIYMITHTLNLDTISRAYIYTHTYTHTHAQRLNLGRGNSQLGLVD